MVVIESKNCQTSLAMDCKKFVQHAEKLMNSKYIKILNAVGVSGKLGNLKIDDSKVTMDKTALPINLLVNKIAALDEGEEEV